jgi:chemotaxis-related protein WspB
VLVLKFQIGANRLALDVRQIDSVVPRVHLRPTPFGPDWLVGVFVFHGRIVPVVDTYRLLGLGDCPDSLSSRIILVPLTPLPGEPAGRKFGLLASHVSDVQDLVRQPESPNVPALDRPELGPVVIDDDGIMHIAAIERLLPAAFRAQLQAIADTALPNPGTGGAK